MNYWLLMALSNCYYDLTGYFYDLTGYFYGNSWYNYNLMVNNG